MKKAACLLLVMGSVAAYAHSPAHIRDSLQRGNTVKAAHQAEEALQDPATTDAAELRYLLLKAHVLDLQPDGGKLYKQMVGKAADGMERYQDHLGTLEAALTAEGESALPLFARLLDSGDPLDRLLVLGLLEEMVTDAAWTSAAPQARESVQEAAGRATQAVAGECRAREAAMAGERDPDGDPIQDDYFQSVYSLLSGVAFLSRTAPASAAGVAVAGLECRGAAGWLVQDRQQLQRLGPDLADPLRRKLESAQRDEVKVDVLILMGRFGRCDDLKLIADYQDEALGMVSVAADSAQRRMKHRLDCSG